VILSNDIEKTAMLEEHRDLIPNEIERAQQTVGTSGFLVADNPVSLAPFVARVEETCENCGGSGYDSGSLSPVEPEDCPVCQGSGKQIVIHNYLAEALRIAAGNSAMLTQREHLVAVIRHCRGLVGALMAIADIR
jgi:hypothetical protein